MITGLKLGEVTEYTLKDDTDNPTVWKIGVIDSYTFAQLAMSNVKSEMERAFQILRIGLKGWENSDFPYEEVEEEMFGQKLKMASLDCIKQIPLTAINELSVAIMNANGISEGESKN